MTGEPSLPAGAVAVLGAEQMLTPPESGLEYLRHDRACELRSEAGGVICAPDGTIAALTGGDDGGDAAVRIDASGAAVIPGLVDCHTHLPFAGWRAAEYEMKVTGVPYEQIAAQGGGIRSSARAFAEADDEQVLAQASALAAEMLAHGTTTLETKSGYGLAIDAELRSLRLADELAGQVPQACSSTALLAHAVPDGTDADAWMEAVEQAMPRVTAETSAEALDIYVETVAFTNEHLAWMGRLASANGLRLRAHVEQFSTARSVPVALEHGARSVDHLACLHPDDLGPIAASECAAVLLPGAEVLGDEHVAPARELADAGAICVLATDCNPGTSPVASLPLIIGLAVRRYGWSVREALLAVTLNAAWVLGRSQRIGAIEQGREADLVILDGPLEHIPYRFGHNPVAAVVRAGELAWVRPDQRWRVAS